MHIDEHEQIADVNQDGSTIVIESSDEGELETSQGLPITMRNFSHHISSDVESPLLNRATFSSTSEYPPAHGSSRATNALQDDTFAAMEDYSGSESSSASSVDDSSRNCAALRPRPRQPVSRALRNGQRRAQRIILDSDDDIADDSD